jgi:hypothetical protein
MTLRTNYMKQDEEDERHAFLGKEAKFRSSNCEIVEFLNRNNEQLGMNGPMKFSLSLTYYMSFVVP